MIDKDMVNDIYDTVIIGGGPSGLLAGYHLVNAKRKILIVEQGKLFMERVDSNEEDVSIGIGGSGLFSDGKFSYFPSATELWNLGYDNGIEESYNDIVKIFSESCVNLQPWKEIFSHTKENEKSNNCQKLYESEYINMQKRIDFIGNICKVIGSNNIITNTKVTSVTKRNNYYEVKLNDTGSIIRANTIIYAAGKYGSYDLKEILNTDKLIFSKYEVGIRLESNSKSFKPYSNKQTDYKYIKEISLGAQVRTFCCCRDGKVIKSKYGKFESFNGSSDVKRTGKSNIGVNIRVTDENINNGLIDEIAKIVDGKQNSFEISLKDFFNSDKTFLGENIDDILKQFILDVIAEPSDSESIIYGPTIEGVGFYPRLEDKELKLYGEPIWVPGDCSGIFRGLAAALISGVYVGRSVEKFLVNNENEMMKQLNIKSSSINDIPLIFTAQSKVFFYCRDVVCEFVLKKDCLPINPFRIFDYFLGDRVDRNLIRRGNNQLIKTCSELWVFGPISDGVLFEIALARRLKIPIKFFSIGTTVEEIHEIDDYKEIIFEPEVHAKQIKREDLIRYVKGGIFSYFENGQNTSKQLDWILGDFE